MKTYHTQDIRNVVFLGHGGCGKTSLVEAMAYAAGLTDRMGDVKQKNTISDYDREEKKRGFSIHMSVIPLEWQNSKINILDTPGYFDFIGETEEALSAADAAVIVISGKAGVEAGTQRAWELCEKYHLPRMFFVTEMDVDNASFREPVEVLTGLYGKRIAPFHQPIRENEKLVGYVNVVKMAGRRFDGPGKSVECEIPDYCKPNLEICREALLDAVAETSEEYMERYFNGEEFTEEEIKQALREHVLDGSIVPVTMGSALQGQGIYNLLTDIVKYFPSPEKKNMDEKDDVSAYIFKTIVDPFIGKYSLFKVRSGIVKTDAVLYNQDKGEEAKIGKVYVMCGNKPIETSELYAGDIGAAAKIPKAATGDTLSLKVHPVQYERAPISVPYTYLRYEATQKGEEDKIAQALAKMMQEDLTLRSVQDTENQQSLLYGMGEQHLEVVASMLEERYKVSLVLSKPKVAFKETILKRAEAQGKHKKQSGGHGQYGDVKMIFEPSGNLEKPYIFKEKIFGGSVPKNYFPAIEKGIADSTKKGPLAGYPVVGIKATLIDGSYHSVDSSEMAFKTAAQLAFKTAFMEATPVLLEPVVTLHVSVPDSVTGDIMGDLNKRRGRVIGMEPGDFGRQEIEAEVPMLELFGYGTELRSMTGGMGDYSYTFCRYEQVPGDIQEKVIKG